MFLLVLWAGAPEDGVSPTWRSEPPHAEAEPPPGRGDCWENACGLNPSPVLFIAAFAGQSPDAQLNAVSGETLCTQWRAQVARGGATADNLYTRRCVQGSLLVSCARSGAHKQLAVELRLITCIWGGDPQTCECSKIRARVRGAFLATRAHGANAVRLDSLSHMHMHMYNMHATLQGTQQ